MALSYTVNQWMFFFYFYCVCGWIWETCLVSTREKRFVNRGFLRGPWLPLYGTGGCMMLMISAPFVKSLPLTFLSGCVGATILEYLTAVWMETLFKVRYWDYTRRRFNFQGRICLAATLCWGVFTVLMTRLVHRPVDSLMHTIPAVTLDYLVDVLTIIFVIDNVMAFRAALDLRRVLIKAQAAREELELMKKRLDVYVALAADDLKDSGGQLVIQGAGHLREEKERLQRRLDVLIALGEDALNDRKDAVLLRRDELMEEFSQHMTQVVDALPYSEKIYDKVDDLIDLRDKAVEMIRSGEQRVSEFMLRGSVRDMLNGNPTLTTSERFSDVLEDLKKIAGSYHRD